MKKILNKILLKFKNTRLEITDKGIKSWKNGKLQFEIEGITGTVFLDQSNRFATK